MFGKRTSIGTLIPTHHGPVKLTVEFSRELDKVFYRLCEEYIISKKLMLFPGKEEELRPKFLEFCKSAIGLCVKQEFSSLSARYWREKPAFMGELATKGITVILTFESGNVGASYRLGSRPGSPLFTLNAIVPIALYFDLKKKGKFAIGWLQKNLAHEFTHYFDIAKSEHNERAGRVKDIAAHNVSTMKWLIRDEGVASLAQNSHTGRIALDFTSFEGLGKLFEAAAAHREALLNQLGLGIDDAPIYEAGKIYAALNLLALANCIGEAKLQWRHELHPMQHLGRLAQHHGRFHILIPLRAFSELARLRTMDADFFLGRGAQILKGLGAREPLFDIPAQIKAA